MSDHPSRQSDTGDVWTAARLAFREHTSSVSGLDELLRNLERALMPMAADWIKVYLARPDGSLELVAAAHRDETLTQTILERANAYPPDATDPVGVGAVWRTGSPELIADIPDALLPALCRDETHLAFTRAIGLRSSLTVPLHANETMIGVVRLAHGPSERRYSDADTQAAKVLLDQIGEGISKLDVLKQAQLEAAHQRREKRLERVSQLRYKALLESSPVSLQVLDASGRTIEVNPAWEEFWGIRIEDDPSYHNPLFENEQLRETGVLEFFSRAFEGEKLQGPPTLYDTSQHTPGGQARWIRALARPVTSSSGRVREVVVAHLELTEPEVEQATRRLSALGVRIPDRLRGHTIHQEDVLSPRENAVLHLVAEGHSNKEIAKVLGISENTAKFHVTSLFNKLGVNSRAMAVSQAVQRGLM